LSAPSRENEISWALPEKSWAPHSKEPTKSHSIRWLHAPNRRRDLFTVVVAENGVEVELSIDLLALTVVQTGSQDMAIVDTDFSGADMERHFDRVVSDGL